MTSLGAKLSSRASLSAKQHPVPQSKIAPIWSNTTWTGALLPASAVSTGVAVIVLVDRRFRLNAAEDTIHRLELLDSSSG
jgi:hypothetical protein